MFSALSAVYTAVAGPVNILISILGGANSVNYYVAQQLAQMQAHHLNKDMIISKADGKTKELIIKIFQKYEKEIESKNWCWIKKEGELHAIPMNNGFVRGKRVKICEEERFDGIFPPLAAIGDTMKECGTRVDVDEVWLEELKAKLKNTAAAYISDLEYWVLQLEALEQDMALNLRF